MFLGDMMLGENVYHLGRGIRSRYGHDYKSFIPEKIRDTLLDGVDAVFYNFEYSLAPDSYQFDDFEQSIYASTVASLDVFPAGLVKIVNVANNHFWERGAERTAFTLAALKEHGFVVVGVSNKPVRLAIKGKNFLIWGVSLIDWDVPVFTAEYNDLIDKMEIPDQKKDDEIWIASIHWGTEFITYPNREQVKLAHELIGHGFDVVHGHHPHVFQKIQFPTTSSLIMYSMGNFVFDENFARETQKSYCLKVGFGESLTCEAMLMTNRNYRPCSIRQVDCKSLIIKPDKYWSGVKKRITKKAYNTLRKMEYISHIADNNFYIYKALKNRKNK